MRFDVFYYSAATGKRLSYCDLDVSQTYVDRLKPGRNTLASVRDSDGGGYWLDGRGSVIDEPAVVRERRERPGKPLTPR